MSFDKGILSGKEKRNPYRGGKAVDGTCRNNKGCPACLSNRTHKYKKSMMKAENSLHTIHSC